MLENSSYLIFKNDQLIVTSDFKPLTEKIVMELASPLSYQHKIYEDSDRQIYCGEVPTATTLPSQLILLPLRQALERLDTDWYTLVAKAYAIINWDKYHYYCGRCNVITHKMEAVFEQVCPTCHNIFYPRISPSVIVLIHHKDQILMARGPHFPKGAYGLIAGFIEPGESAEDAIHREVKEEVGIQVKELKYFGSQAWPFPDSLMFAFTAQYLSGELVIDKKEIEHAAWYPYHAIPGRPSSKISIATKLLDSFIERMRKGEDKI